MFGATIQNYIRPDDLVSGVCSPSALYEGVHGNERIAPLIHNVGNR